MPRGFFRWEPPLRHRCGAGAGLGQGGRLVRAAAHRTADGPARRGRVQQGLVLLHTASENKLLRFVNDVNTRANIGPLGDF